MSHPPLLYDGADCEVSATVRAADAERDEFMRQHDTYWVG